ncbi:MAG: hypothetical protein ACYTEK_14875 [Planctomycetota bacterium]
MSKRLFASLGVLGLSMLAVIVYGCGANRVDLVDAGVLTLEQRAEGKVQIAWSSAYEDEDGFVVAGVLTRHDRVGLPIRAHVDVVLLSPDKRILDESRTRDTYVPARITGRGQSLKRFRARFPHIPPRGSSVRLVCHSALHDETT